MPISSTQLKQQVDLPIWEWLRTAPVVSTGGLSASTQATIVQYGVTNTRYVYILLNATNFWRYDTITDSWAQLASPGITPLTATNMTWAGTLGYQNRVISATSNTFTSGLPFNGSSIGYKVRIISGTGRGQERQITNVSDSVIADFGAATAGSSLATTDANKTWTVNNWSGYMLRIVGGTGINQARKILYNSSTVLTIADTNIYAYDSFSVPMSPTAGTAGMTATAAGSMYQIESSVATVDTPWDVIPDSTSRFVIQTGGLWMISGASLANGVATIQYYSPLEDIWYAKNSVSNLIPVSTVTDISIERFGEARSTWYSGVPKSATSTTITDTTASWTTNQWVGYWLFIYSGTGRNQLTRITSNTQVSLTFDALTTAPDTTSLYNIIGFDAGTLTSSIGRVVFDSTKTWTLNQWSNYAIRIMAGTGSGQIRQIQSNGTNSLVLYEPWNVQPDSTSIYSIQGMTNDMIFQVGGSGQTYIFRAGDTDMISNGRVLDEGIISVACAMLCDGTSTATHEIFEQKQVAISALAGTSTITATTVQPHQFKVGQWVSIRGVTSATADIYNITGKVQILSVPTTTSFTYTPFAAGTGTYQYSNNVVIGTTVLPDSSKVHADLATGGSTTTVTFSRAQPSNINGWYAYGTNIAAGAQVVSGAGTTTLTLNIAGPDVPSDVITFYKTPLPVTATYSSGGGAGVFNATMTATVPSYVRNWLATGTGIGLSAYVTGGEGTTTPNFSIQCSGAVSGTITFSQIVNQPLPVTATYSSGSGSSIVLTSNVPTYVNGWSVSGTNIDNGTVIVSGQGTSTITLSVPTTGAPTGTITFYPPQAAIAMYYGTTAGPTVAATGALAAGNTMQMVAQNASNSTVYTPLAAIAGVNAATTKYVIARRDMIGQAYFNQNLIYLSGVATSGSTTTLVDTNSFWATATGTGSSGATTITLSAIGSPIHNGWYVTGTGIGTGARIIGGAGTTTLTLDTPNSGAVSGTITICAWGPAAAATSPLVNRRLRVLSSGGVNQELIITAVAPATGTITFGAATAVTANASYTVMPTIVLGAGSQCFWASNSSAPTVRQKGRYFYRSRGGATVGFDRIDLTTDSFMPLYTVPFVETLGSGSMYAYDGTDRLYFTKDVTNRVYYLDLNSLTVQASGLFPYLAGTAGVGNKMEIFTTSDGLQYLWLNRQGAVEAFRALIFW